MFILHCIEKQILLQDDSQPPLAIGMTLCFSHPRIQFAMSLAILTTLILSCTVTPHFLSLPLPLWIRLPRSYLYRFVWCKASQIHRHLITVYLFHCTATILTRQLLPKAAASLSLHQPPSTPLKTTLTHRNNDHPRYSGAHPSFLKGFDPPTWCHPAQCRPPHLFEYFRWSIITFCSASRQHTP